MPARVALLAALLGVFGWRVRSCQAEVEEKRRVASLQEARVRAQTRTEPSPLPLDPYARRAAMAASLRLRPDRRFLLAAAHILKLTGGEPASAEARFEGGRWILAAGGDPLGEVSELPDYQELMRPLVALAQRRLAAAPLSGTEAPAEGGGLEWEPDARAAFPAELARWAGGARTAATLHRSARAGASLCFYLVDSLGTDDELAAKAIGLVALDIAAGREETGGEQAVLASALGYVRAARELGAQLPAGSSLSFYLAGDDAHLEEGALLRDATPSDRYLRLRRAILRNDEDAANRFLDSYHGTERLDLAVLALLLREGRMEHFAPVAFGLPVLLLAAAEGVAVRVPPQNSQSQTVQLSVRAAALALSVDADKLSVRLEAALQKADPDLREYLRAAWLSALRRQGEYLADAQADRESSVKFLQTLAEDPAPTVQRFQRWFAAHLSARSGRPAEALAAVERLEGVGGSAIGDLLEQAAARAAFADPRLLRAVRALVPRLDSRVAHRATLGNIAWSPLQDLRASQRLLSSALEADPDGLQSLREWFANLSGDAARLEGIGRDRYGLRHVRSRALQHLWELGGEHAAAAEQALRSMIDEDPSDPAAALDLGKQLRLAGRLEDARAVLLAWLRGHEAPDVRTANVRGALARYSFLAGRYSEGLEAAGPALPVGNALAIEFAALNLAGAGRAVEARAMADTLVERYHSPSAAARAAEVEWQLGDLDAAGKRLAGAAKFLSAADYHESVAEGFGRLFGDRPDRAAAAVAAAARAGVASENLFSLGGALDLQGHFEAAFRAMEALPEQGPRADLVRVTASRSLRRARGDDAARAWLQTTFSSVPDDRGRRLSMLAFRDGMPELVWDVVPDPKGTDDYAETTWMLRAAQVALQKDAASPERKKALLEHYASVQKATRHTQIGRYLIGEVAEGEIAKLVTDLPASCEVPYYFGVRAQGEKRIGDAADWYRVAMECGAIGEAEYLYAVDELYRWRGQKGVFSRIR